jgi:hypothetical protein
LVLQKDMPKCVLRVSSTCSARRVLHFSVRTPQEA